MNDKEKKANDDSTPRKQLSPFDQALLDAFKEDARAEEEMINQLETGRTQEPKKEDAG